MQKIMRLAFAIAVVALAPLAQAQKKPGDVTVEDFFKRAQYRNMQLSPNGALLAASAPLHGRDNLVIIDLAKKSRTVITDFSHFDVGNFYWVNNQRLCLQVADGQDVSGEFNYRGTYCIDANGDNIRNYTKLGVRDPDNSIGRYRTIRLRGLVHDESGEMLAEMTLRSSDSYDVYRFNTLTGRYKLLTEDSPGDVSRWVLDRNDVPRVAVSQPRCMTASCKYTTTIWYRDGEGAKWEKLFETETLGDMALTNGGFSPIAFDYDNSTLYVSSRKDGDKSAIYIYDTKARKMGEKIFAHPMIDLGRNNLIFGRMQKKLLGIRYEADMPTTTWVDPTMDRLQKSIDAALPKTINEILTPSETDKVALMFAHSDRDPGAYYLLNRVKPAVELVAKTREWIDPELMAERRFIKYKARDGLEIPAWVTIPKGGGKNLPLIVNIHGGPWVRGYHGIEWGRWPEAQFFASRGYVVLEPEPRGSLGYGLKHYKSSFKQWGQAMQDDITDGALYLVSEGLVDKSRMCLHGGSYGGYATAMGLAKDPDLWKCGSPFVAVTDLFLFQNVTYSDISYGSYYFQTDFKKLVGDSSADRDMFTRYSPAQQAAKIKAPVLITMGSADMRVPQVHGDSFVSALRDAGKKVDYVIYKGEGHGYNKDENVFDFYKRLEKFYGENLKP
jgi:dipeptidyl aminopeptidase/acylaminoacyl peptidase